MKKQKFTIFMALLVAAVIVFNFFGCQQHEPPLMSGPPTPENPLILKMCHVFSLNTIMDQAVRMVAENVERRTNGAIKIEVSTDGVLPVLTDGVEMCIRGAKYICHTDISGAADWVPEYIALSGPFLVDSVEEFQQLCESDLVAEFNAKAERAGIKVLAIPYCFGFRNIASKKLKIDSIDDMKGIQMRVPALKQYLETFKALGSNVISTPSSEVYNAMQTGLADAHETSLSDLVEMQMYEVDRYITLTKHFLAMSSSVMSADVFNSLNAEQQDIMMEEFKKGGEWCTAEYEKYDIESKQLMIDKGVEFVEIDDLTPFREATKVVYTQEIFPELPPDIYDRLQAELEVIRSRSGK